MHLCAALIQRVTAKRSGGTGCSRTAGSGTFSTTADSSVVSPIINQSKFHLPFEKCESGEFYELTSFHRFPVPFIVD